MHLYYAVFVKIALTNKKVRYIIKEIIFILQIENKTYGGKRK